MTVRIHRSFLGWGIFFILVGAVPLAFQAGWLTSEQVASAWTLWPLILVGIGLGLVLRRTPLEGLGGLIVAGVFGIIIGGLLRRGHRRLLGRRVRRLERAATVPRRCGEPRVPHAGLDRGRVRDARRHAAGRSRLSRRGRGCHGDRAGRHGRRRRDDGRGPGPGTRTVRPAGRARGLAHRAAARGRPRSRRSPQRRVLDHRPRREPDRLGLGAAQRRACGRRPVGDPLDRRVLVPGERRIDRAADCRRRRPRARSR